LADQLAALSKLPNDMIPKLAQLGLLDERWSRFGFRDLASARQIAKLGLKSILAKIRVTGRDGTAELNPPLRSQT
jgi:hypothetical protein